MAAVMAMTAMMRSVFIKVVPAINVMHHRRVAVHVWRRIYYLRRGVIHMWCSVINHRWRCQITHCRIAMVAMIANTDTKTELIMCMRTGNSGSQ